MKHSVIKSTQVRSPLIGLSQVRPKNTASKKSLMANIILTSLVDAFSILVIYLIINTSTSSEIIKNNKGVQLPQAKSTLSLEEGVIVKIIDGKYFINEEPASKNKLIAELNIIKNQLESENKKVNLIIQADKKEDFSMINPILVSSAATGFETIKFAVIPQGGSKLWYLNHLFY